jgi:4-carboxymuconolactone decarboxylase
MHVRLIAAAIVLRLAGPVFAQDRLPPIPPDKMTNAQKKAAATFKDIRGVEINGPFHPLNRSPELMALTAALGNYLRYKTVLGHSLNEFLILVAARHYSSGYEWSIHGPAALAAGVKPEIVKAISEGRRPDNMTAEQEIAYNFVDELLNRYSVDDVTYARAVKQFGEQGVVEMVGVMGYYTYMGMILNTSRTPPDTPGAPTLPPLIPAFR